MDEETVRLLISTVGVVATIGIFWFLAFKVGNFTLLPGEGRRILWSVGIGLPGALGFLLLVQALPPAAGSVVFYIGLLAGVGYMFTRGRPTRLIQERPAEERAELERRLAFFRSRRSVPVFVAFAISLVVGGIILSVVATP